MQGTAPPTKQQWGLQMASSMSWKNVQQNVQSVQFKKSGEAPIGGWIRPVDSKDRFNPHASEFNPLGFSSGMYSFRQHASRQTTTNTHDKNNKTGFKRNNFRSQSSKQPSIQEKKFNVVPLGDVPPELVKHLEMRNPSGFVYTVPESSQTVEFWEGVKNKPPSSINILEEIKSN